MIDPMSDAVCVDERDKFRNNANLFDNEASAAIKDSLTWFDLPCLLDKFHSSRSSLRASGYAWFHRFLSPFAILVIPRKEFVLTLSDIRLTAGAAWMSALPPRPAH